MGGAFQARGCHAFESTTYELTDDVSGDLPPYFRTTSMAEGGHLDPKVDRKDILKSIQIGHTKKNSKANRAS